MSDPETAIATEDVEAVIRLAEYLRKQDRRHRWTRRAKKAGLVALVPIAGPLVGDIWAEQDREGWR